jgi:hypothetical protein
LFPIFADPIWVVTWSEFQKVSTRRKEERRAKKSLETSLKKNRPILFLGFWDHFELYAIIVKKIWHLHAFRSSCVQFSEISKKNLVPILIFHLADRFETLSICCVLVSRRDSWCSRLASLAWASLGPAQYHRWAVIQPRIAVLNFCYRYCSHPELHIFLHRALTPPGNRSIESSWSLIMTVADRHLLPGKNG